MAPLSVLAVDALAQVGIGGYVVLYLSVAASWVGVPIVGAGVLAAAGVLASEGELNLWLVIGVATVAAWTGGYIGYVLGARAVDAVSRRPGRWRRQRQHALKVGERIYRQWGRFAVFVTPTWVSDLKPFSGVAVGRVGRSPHRGHARLGRLKRPASAPAEAATAVREVGGDAGAYR